MRVIKFRGFRGNTLIKEWVYGDLITFEGRYQILDSEGVHHFVDKDSVGQYTGLKDKKGVEIYEGDIITTFDQNNIIVFIEGAFIVKGLHKDKYLATYEHVRYYLVDSTLPNRSGIVTTLEVVDNICENPELLKN